MNAYTPEQARRMEDALIQLWKPAPGAGKTPLNGFTGGKCPDRIAEGNRKKQAALDLIGPDWVKPSEIMAQLPDKPSAIRSAIDSMIRDGRLQGEMRKGRLYVRKPGKAA